MRTINALRRTAVLALVAALAPACDNRSSGDGGNGGSFFGLLANGWGYGWKAAPERPAVQITTPTSTPEVSTTADVVDVAGQAADQVGIAIVTWTNATMGMSGIAEGTTSWTATIPLEPGENLVEVTVTNSRGATATDAILITLDARR